MTASIGASGGSAQDDGVTIAEYRSYESSLRKGTQHREILRQWGSLIGFNNYKLFIHMNVLLGRCERLLKSAKGNHIYCTPKVNGSTLWNTCHIFQAVLAV